MDIFDKIMIVLLGFVIAMWFGFSVAILIGINSIVGTIFLIIGIWVVMLFYYGIKPTIINYLDDKNKIK